ncbi:unnamed protein product [Camellia sinensis]
MVHDAMRGNWFIIFMYGSPRILARGQVWSSIESRFQKFLKPFIIMGDLNQVRGWAEKLSSHKGVIPGAPAFNDLIFRNRLVDLPSQGVWYTWCNNRKETEAVYERLDRVLALSCWTTLFSQFSLVTLPIHRSDHSPLFLDTSRIEPFGPKWGRFEAVWLADPSTHDIIQKIWHSPTPDAAACVQRQTIVYRHLKNWNALSFRSLQGQIDDIHARLRQVQESLPNLGLYSTEQELRFHLDILLQQQELYWAQRAKQHWMSLGDRNTKFFHRMASWRRSRNRIALIQDHDGHVLTQPKDIQMAFVAHFKHLFSSSSPCIAAGPCTRIVVDGSWVAVGERTGLAWVCFDSDDHQVYEEAILGPSMLSPQQVEAAAVLHAMRWAVQSGINHLLIQTDCLVLLLLLHHHAQESDWSLQSILADILLLCKSFDHVVLQKVDRDVVHAAHKLATDVR